MSWRRIWRIVVLGTGAAFAGAMLSADLQNRRLTYPDPPAKEAVAELKAPSRPDVVLLPKPADAILMASADISTVDPFSWQFTRYLWVPSASKDAMRTISLVCNYVSRGGNIIRPIPVADGHLLRIDLRYYAPKEADLREWLSTWESFAFDPTFSLLITKDNVAFAEKLAEIAPVIVTIPAVIIPPRRESRVVDHPGGRYDYPDDSGRRHDNLPAGRYTVDLEFRGVSTKAITRKKAVDFDVLRENAPSLPRQLMTKLQSQTQSLAPVVEFRYFLTRAMSTIKDDGVYRQVFSGIYYDLKGIKKAKAVLGANTKATDLDLFLERLGVGNIKAGLTSEQLFDQIPSDRRVAMQRSDVTGSQREVTLHHVLTDGDGVAFGAITGDLKRKSIDIGQRPMANLLKPFRDAREVIFPSLNGLDVFGIFDGQGNLLDVVAQEVAHDTTVPRPFHDELQPSISCIRCHGPHDGWFPLRNDAAKLLTGKLDLFGDLGVGRKAFDPETNDRLASLFSGDFTKNLKRARDDVAEVTLRATGPWKPGETNADAAKVGAEKMGEVYADYNYTMVDSRIALRELGYDVVPSRAKEIFDRLMAVDLKQPVAGIYLENPTIASLKDGIPVLRTDWALVYSSAADRAARNAGRVVK